MAWSLAQVLKHNNEQSCYVIINNNVYDVTEFLDEHPGGRNIILKYAGRDASAAYEPIHPKDALQTHLPPSKHLGPLDSDSARVTQSERANRKKTQDELRVEKARSEKPPLARMIGLHDLEKVAQQVLSYKAWSYYHSGSDDQISLEENARAFSRFFFHPRVMRPVSKIDTSTSILGYKSSIPVFVSGAALAKLGHPQGEINITRGAHATGIIQMVSSNASLSFAEIAEARASGQTLFFQLYKHTDNDVALKRVREIERLGYKAIFLTVDAIVAGNREADIKAPWVEEEMEKASSIDRETAGGDVPQTLRGPENEDEFEDSNVEMGGTAGALVKNDDRDMTWSKTIPWLRSITKLPIVVKGVQCVEDCVLAAEAGVDGVLLSNHGGRQLEYALPPIEVLYRLRVQRPDVFDKIEVYIDGGVRRGTDVVKALCLGATAVGLGRPFLYAQSAYGAAGVVKAVRILEREIYNAMALTGVRNVRELTPNMVERVDWDPLVPKARL